MTLALVPIAPDADPEALAARVAPGFGGDPDAARDLLAQTIALLNNDPRAAPWGCYLARQGDAWVGTCAFKSAPANGEVEIAYMTFPAFEGRGHATAMARALTGMAESESIRPIAHTLPEENASNKALRRSGYAFAGEVMDPEDGLVWRWEKADAP